MITTQQQVTATKSILIYGGAFNPPTLGHQDIIDAALKESSFDEIWLMPSRDRLDKIMCVDEPTRVAMLQTMLDSEYADQPRLRLSTFELGLPQPTETYQTHLALRVQHPTYRFTYLVGEDSIATMPTWQNADALLHGLDWLVATRKHANIAQWPDSCRYLPIVARNISSTMVRTRAGKKQDFSELVCPAVLSFITKRRLYE